MAVEKPIRRMTLRELTTHAEKCSRALIEHLNSTLLPQVSDFRDLSRPVRRRTHYPAMVAVHNGLKNLLGAGAEALALTNDLHEQLDEVRQRALMEKANRV